MIDVIKIKNPRGEITLTEKDVIMDNQACFQLMTQTYFQGFHNYSYKLSSGTCRRLIKQGKLELFKSTGSLEDRNKLDYYRVTP